MDILIPIFDMGEIEIAHFDRLGNSSVEGCLVYLLILKTPDSTLNAGKTGIALLGEIAVSGVE